MTITLVRHGEVDEAFHRCYNGHNDIALSPKGQEEALELAQHLKEKSFDAIYSSDLRRCQETLKPIINQLNLSTSTTVIPAEAGMTAIPTLLTKELREKSWGRHEGMTFDAIVERDGLIYKHFEQWINALDGEPYDAYIERIQHFFTQTLPQTGYNSVLVVTHAGVIRVLMHILKEITLEEAFSIDFPYSAYTTLDSDTWKFGETVCVS